MEKETKDRQLDENSKKETFQEWYGKLNNEKFPHFRTKEKRNQLFVCLKMLSIFHDVPFQRFAAKRLLSNFLKGDKISILRFRRRKHSMRKVGHRAKHSKIEIKNIKLESK